MEQHQQAWQRGVRMANYWIKLRSSAFYFDACCMAKAKKSSLPNWVGHIPLIIMIFLSLICVIVGGIALASCTVFLWALALIVQNAMRTNNDSSVYSSNEDPKNDLCDEFVMDSATNNEYDGAPYKSPSED
ncbi:TPA: hypothetical protein PFE07_002542 [Kluyvera cryocrescens]|nr:hypothetical protein [Kluyvera cryocrescens]